MICKTCCNSIKDAYKIFLWEDVCRQKGLFKHILLFKTSCDETLDSIRDLENDGYILSTETNQHTIAIKPLGEHDYTDGEHEGILYCLKPEEHMTND